MKSFQVGIVAPVPTCERVGDSRASVDTVLIQISSDNTRSVFGHLIHCVPCVNLTTSDNMGDLGRRAANACGHGDATRALGSPSQTAMTRRKSPWAPSNQLGLTGLGAFVFWPASGSIELIDLDHSLREFRENLKLAAQGFDDLPERRNLHAVRLFQL